LAAPSGGVAAPGAGAGGGAVAAPPATRGGSAGGGDAPARRGARARAGDEAPPATRRAAARGRTADDSSAWCEQGMRAASARVFASAFFRGGAAFGAHARRSQARAHNIAARTVGMRAAGAHARIEGTGEMCAPFFGAPPARPGLFLV
jgi:hypothetical protein